MSYKIQAKTTFGRFAYTASATFEEISEPVSKPLAKVLEDGVLSVCFRAGGSEAQKALVKHGGNADAYDKVPAGPITDKTPRGAIPWTQDRQAVLEMAMLDKLDKLGLSVINIEFTGEHVIAENKGALARAEKDYAEWQSATPDVKAAMALIFGVKDGMAKDEAMAIFLKRYK